MSLQASAIGMRTSSSLKLRSAPRERYACRKHPASVMRFAERRSRISQFVRTNGWRELDSSFSDRHADNLAPSSMQTSSIDRGPVLKQQTQGHLKANALSLGDAIILGLASSAPAQTMAVALPALIAACNYAGLLPIVCAFIPMLGIALGYERLNRW